MSSTSRGWAAVALVALTACALFGRGGGSPPPPFDIAITAGQRLNPDERGDSLPTLVRVLQLKSVSKLAGADFDQIYRVPKETLGEDLVRMDELFLSPGETAQRRIERDKAARALAVVPVVRRPTGKSWRTIVELPPPDGHIRFTFLIEGYRVERR